MIAQRRSSAPAQIQPNPLARDLSLELGEGQQHVESQRPMLVVVLKD